MAKTLTWESNGYLIERHFDPNVWNYYQWQDAKMEHSLPWTPEDGYVHDMTVDSVPKLKFVASGRGEINVYQVLDDGEHTMRWHMDVNPASENMIGRNLIARPEGYSQLVTGSGTTTVTTGIHSLTGGRAYGDLFIDGDIITTSFDLRIDGDPGAATVIAQTGNVYWDGLMGKSQLPDSEGHFSGQYTVRASRFVCSNISFRFDNLPEGTKVTISNIKVELGQEETPYSVAPEYIPIAVEMGEGELCGNNLVRLQTFNADTSYVKITGNSRKMKWTQKINTTSSTQLPLIEALSSGTTFSVLCSKPEQAPAQTVLNLLPENKPYWDNDQLSVPVNGGVRYRVMATPNADVEVVSFYGAKQMDPVTEVDLWDLSVVKGSTIYPYTPAPEDISGNVRIEVTGSVTIHRIQVAKQLL